jgi:hypothetical protein
MKLVNGKFEMSQEEIRSVCDAAQSAWDKVSPRARKITFMWRNQRYQSQLTSFRMRISLAARRLPLLLKNAAMRDTHVHTNVTSGRVGQHCFMG